MYTGAVTAPLAAILRRDSLATQGRGLRAVRIKGDFEIPDLTPLLYSNLLYDII